MNIQEVKDLIEEGKSTRYISKQIGVSRTDLMWFMKENNLTTKFNRINSSTNLVLLCVGEKYGKLTITKEGERVKYGMTYYCDCECGKKNVLAYAKSLKNEKKLSCGCLVGKAKKKIGPRKTDKLIGKKFNRLTVNELKKIAYGKYLVVCKCDCGGTCTTRGDFLKSGRTKSCGCLQKEKASYSGSKYGCKNGRFFDWYFISKEGHKIKCDSGFEVIYANYLKDNNIDFIYHPQCFKLYNKRYTPDFLLTKTMEYIEIKGYERSKNQINIRSEFSKDNKLHLIYWKDLVSIIKGLPFSYSTAMKRCGSKRGIIEDNFSSGIYLKSKIL